MRLAWYVNSYVPPGNERERERDSRDCRAPDDSRRDTVGDDGNGFAT